jgi:hypothetical protein
MYIKDPSIDKVNLFIEILKQKSQQFNFLFLTNAPTEKPKLDVNVDFFQRNTILILNLAPFFAKFRTNKL